MAERQHTTRGQICHAGIEMKLAIVASVGLALAVVAGAAAAQAAAPPVESKSTAPRADAELGKLQGRWVRPDGGYVIAIRSVDANGKLDAAYANPNPLPFARAEATRDGTTLRLFFELRAGGYNGSTYALTYDPASDVLRGVYYQAVAQQKFDVVFTRAR
jgi:hypothetical protein